MSKREDLDAAVRFAERKRVFGLASVVRIMTNISNSASTAAMDEIVRGQRLIEAALVRVLREAPRGLVVK